LNYLVSGLTHRDGLARQRIGGLEATPDPRRRPYRHAAPDLAAAGDGAGFKSLSASSVIPSRRL
jgi:hypothetical protein